MGGLRPPQVTAGGGRGRSGSSTLLGFLMGPHGSSVLAAQAGSGISIFKISQVIKMNLWPRLEPLAHPWTSYHSMRWGTSLMGCPQERVSACWSLPCCSLGAGAFLEHSRGPRSLWEGNRMAVSTSPYQAKSVPEELSALSNPPALPQGFFSHLLDLYYFPGAAVTNYHKPSGLKQQKLFSHNSGD